MLTLNQIHHGNALDLAAQLAPQSINTLLTSPPYFNLRSYSGPDIAWPEVTYSPLYGLPLITIPAMTCPLGREKTIEAYIGHLVAMFRALWDGLRDDGVVWINIGDSYSNDKKWGGRSGRINCHSTNGGYQDVRNNMPKTGLPPKSLCGIPWRLSLALQADGWILRSDIIWHKTNGQPSSVKDRPTASHEYLFLLAKQPHYWYDHEAIKVPVKQSTCVRLSQDIDSQTGSARANGGAKTNGFMKAVGNITTANRRSVWPMATAQFKGSHYAVMPSEMAELCILAGCPAEVCSECGTPYERVIKKNGHKNKRKPAHVPGNHPTQVSSTGWKPTSRGTSTFEPVCTCNASTRPGVVLDPFMGSGTVAEAAIKFGRNWLGFDLDEECIRLTNTRIHGTQMMVPGVDNATTI